MTIKGSTRIQKYGFLASQLYSKELVALNFYDDWVAYTYGPHSMDLVQDLRKGVEDNYIDEKIEQTHNGRRMHTYSLKLKGRDRLQELSNDYSNMIKNLYEKFTELNKKTMNAILRDIYESYPKYTTNSKIKEEVLNHTDDFMYEKFENEDLSPEIAEKVELAQSGRIKGKKYTPSEYLQHIDEILKD